MKTKSLRKILLGISASALSCTMVFSAVLPNFGRSVSASSEQPTKETTLYRDITGAVDTRLEDYLDTSVTQKLPDTVLPGQEISVMLALAGTETILDGYDALGKTSMTVADFAVSRQGKSIATNIERENKVLQSKLNRAGLKYELGVSYNTLIGGFEVVIQADQFEKLQNAVGKSANVFVSEVYNACETEIVENDVNVYDTGIFDSSDSKYDGTGTVVAVLDTGLDYTHSAFDPVRFTAPAEDDVITLNSISGILNKLAAASTTKGLTASDLYINRKVPFAYDYADKDPDVYPINSEHGTHVSGIILGKDSTITGVAPNAQLASMKVFSDAVQGAKQSWIVAALEDCVTLGVDVINMSLGSSCGFSREIDSDQRTAVYDAIKEHGISLITAASNDYNSTMGSTKNGNLGLTSNPDSATVGSPSTYDASLSVASISGTKTPYMRYEDTIIYFKEARDSASEEKHFVDEILAAGETSKEFTYVTIPGIGREEDYASLEPGYLNGKIALVRRGQTNFEDKVRIAQEQGAAGCIIYNNVSGDISMTIGHANLPTCSISMDDGYTLIAAEGGEGKISISRDQVAGPFMSDFSSWGPTPNLGIKPEITAHGGDILSAVPGQRYDRLSGTSMASPNQAGVTALVRQYVKENFSTNSPVEVVEIVNQLMMSTTDIARNTNGLPFSVRKQGSGLANLTKATSTPAYIRTYERDAYDRRSDKTGEYEINDKTKVELGDDPDKTGIYSFSFEVVNISSSSVSYDVGAIVMTEGVSEQITYRGDTTVTEKGYMLDGARITVTGIKSGTNSGNNITVGGNSTAVVSVEITLGESDKAYLDASFANGMYVEGFVTLTAASGTSVDLNVCYLTFYGDWTQAPLFDLDYFETHRDELNENLLDNEKVLPDAYATRPIGGLYDDYIAYLGTFPYLQDPNSTNKVYAQRDRISLTNQEGERGGVNSISQVWAGMLRGAKRIEMQITDDSTGEVIWTRTEYNQKKTSHSGSSFYGTRVDVEFSVREHDLKNNTKYNFSMTCYLDYADGGIDTNLKNTFEFSFYTDFEAPIVTGVEYRSVYDQDLKKNRLYADVSLFDNHYVTGFIAGLISKNADYDPNDSDSYLYSMGSFGRYITPVGGTRNSTNKVEIELTDYLDEIKNESYDGRSWIIQVMDNALNSATYEFEIPDEIKSISFKEMTPDEDGNVAGVRISPNELYRLNPVTFPAQDKSWAESVHYTSSNENVVRVINGQLVGVASGEATITAVANNDSSVKAELKVTVLKEGDEDYKSYDKLEAESFTLRGYYVNKVFYRISSSDRDLGVDYAYSDSGVQRFVEFTTKRNFALSMFPSESVTIECDIQGFANSENYRVVYVSNNSDVAEVTEDGKITALNVRRYQNADGTERVVPQNTTRTTTISISLQMRDDNGSYVDEDGNRWKDTRLSQSITITVKQPYTTQGPWIMSYMGLGGTVEVPDDLGSNTVYQYAFSNYRLIPKDLSAGDEITEEDPYHSKTWFIGEDTIEEIILPEGIETIESYAFAGLTKLKRIVLPTTLLKIQTGAFYGCTALETVEFRDGKNNLQFINGNGFYGCSSLKSFDFASIIAFGDGAFEGANLESIVLPESAQSIGARAFMGNSRLATLTIRANRVKIGANAFAACERLSAATINASVIPEGVFDECTQLMSVTLGPDVAVIGQYAFRRTSVTSFTVQSGNKVYEAQNGGEYLIEQGTGRLALVAPTVTRFNPANANITTVATGAFSTAGTRLSYVNLPNVTVVEDYAFAYCTGLKTVNLGALKSVGQYAFYETALTRLPKLEAGVTIGDYAFAETDVNTIELSDGTTAGNYAFAYNDVATLVTLGNNVTLGEYAFFSDYKVANVTIGDNAVIGNNAFMAITALEYDPENAYFLSGKQVVYNGQTPNTTVIPMLSSLSRLTIGKNAVIGDYAFYGAGPGSYTNGLVSINNGTLRSVNLGEGATIGAYAFYGCNNLTSINLSQVKAIGAYAFSGMTTEYLLFSSGEVLEVGTIITAPQMTSVDISSATSIGEGAFEGNEKLVSVSVNPVVTELGAAAFSGCIALESIDLSNFEVIGDLALYKTAIKNATLKEGAQIGDGAFANNEKLVKVNGLEKAVKIGDYAFMATGISEANLAAATEIGTFAFMNSAVTSVSLSDNLVKIGENPFTNCMIPAFTRIVNDETISSFDIGEKGIKVIDGVLYRTSVNGMELITYPIGIEADSFEVATGTIRIGANAFMNATLNVVTVAREVNAIGDKAFYGCEKLMLVTFRGRVAPRLEEAYDYDFDEGFDEDGISLYLGSSVGKVVLSYRDGTSRIIGKQLVPFRMWNYNQTTVLYGANFVYGIADERQASHTLIMVRPSNGSGYENFTYSRYFDIVIEGRAAITDAALEVIARIQALPALGDLDVDNWNMICEIMDLYNQLDPEDQAYLNSEGYYQTLSSAYNIVNGLLPPEKDPNGGGDDKKPETESNPWKTVGITMIVVSAVLVVALVAVLCLKKKGVNKEESKDSQNSEEEKSE